MVYQFPSNKHHSRAKTEAPTLNRVLPKADWIDAHETTLCNTLWHYAQVEKPNLDTKNDGIPDPDGFERTITQVREWPSYTGRANRYYQFSNGEVLDSTSNPPITLQVNSLPTNRNSFELETI